MHVFKVFSPLIVQQGMNHDRPYFSNISGVNMLILMANYYSFYKQHISGYKPVWYFFESLWFLLVAGVHLIEIH